MQVQVTEIVTNLVQFAIIAELDDIYALSIKNNFLVKLVEETSLDFSQIKNNAIYKRSGRWSKCGYYLTYKLSKTIYESFYYYFAPMTVIFISFYRLNS